MQAPAMQRTVQPGAHRASFGQAPKGARPLKGEPVVINAANTGIVGNCMSHLALRGCLG